ncbi:DUF4185 domain-containing protein, partial [Gordonia amicalis]|nr:DUF4185 domain-containing protein [Gordonia amicalis]
PIVGLQVRHMSVAYNSYLKKFVLLTERGGSIMVRWSRSAVGGWRGADAAARGGTGSAAPATGCRSPRRAGGG